MNKQIFILAMAAIGFVACSSDETIAVNNSTGNEISFRSSVAGQTRATATTLTTIQSNGFYVGAWYNSDHNSYFADIQFTKDGDTNNYRSATKYYWPSGGVALDFVGYYPNVDNTVLTHGAWNTFTFVPAADPASHTDYVIAATLNRPKAGSSTGIPLAFQHLGSWVVIKAYNSKNTAAGNLTTTVSGWKIGYVYNGGVYTVGASTVAGTPLPSSGWNYSAYARVTDNIPFTYKKEITAAAVTPTTSADATQLGDAIIVPQEIPTALTSSSTYGTNGFLTGAFIAVKLLIQDKAGTPNTIADATGDRTIGETAYDVWAIWPISNNFEAGKKYTYTIDLSQGGYKEMGTQGEVLEPWLDGSEIFFSSVSVDSWTDFDGDNNTNGTQPIDVGM